MRDIIRRHNRLNGFLFSTIEFALLALFTGAFATYYVIHHRMVMALISSGITLNCFPVVLYGIRALREKPTQGERIERYWDRRTREQHRRENPHMLRDTPVLTTATLLPLVSLVTVLFEAFKLSKDE